MQFLFSRYLPNTQQLKAALPGTIPQHPSLPKIPVTGTLQRRADNIYAKGPCVPAKIPWWFQIPSAPMFTSLSYSETEQEMRNLGEIIRDSEQPDSEQRHGWNPKGQHCSFQEKELLPLHPSPFSCRVAELGRIWLWSVCNHQQEENKLGSCPSEQLMAKNKGSHEEPSEIVPPPPSAVLGNREPISELRWGGISGHILPDQVSSTVFTACFFISDVEHPWLWYLDQLILSHSMFHHNPLFVLLSPPFCLI